MLIPIGTNVEHARYPLVTYVLIALNLLVFALQWSVQRAGDLDNEMFFSEVLFNARLSSENFHVYSLFTYQFLHAGWIHILGNMIFLLPFGKAVEDRMGHIGFALFYLGCGAFGGFLHTMYTTSTVIGASGSVCAVTAAFLVLAPKTHIRVLLVFFIIGVYQIPSILLVLFFVLFDVFNLLASMAGANADPTAWVVHLGGYASGFILTFSLLGLKVIASSEYDLTQMFKQAKRRREYKKIIASTSSPHQIEKKMSATEIVRMNISELAARGNTLGAAEKYLQACETKPKIKINRKLQSSLGNALLSEGRIKDGVFVYEKYLAQHAQAEDCEEIALLLAAKYVRNLNNKVRARELLEEYTGKFSEKHSPLVATLTSELL